MCASRRKEFWRLNIIWWSTVLHATWGILVLFSPDALGATPVALLDLLVPGDRIALGVMFLLVAAIALVGLWSKPGKVRQLMFLPQQVFLLTAAIGCASAIARGQYLDGTPRPPLFILADQLPIILLAIAYVVSVLTENGVHHAPSSD